METVLGFGVLAAAAVGLQQQRRALQREAEHRRQSIRNATMPVSFPLTNLAQRINPKRFQNQVVLITGAGSGIGRAIAIQFALEGASVAVNDLPSNEEGIQGTIDAALAINPNAMLKGFPCDVSHREGGRLCGGYGDVRCSIVILLF